MGWRITGENQANLQYYEAGVDRGVAHSGNASAFLRWRGPAGRDSTQASIGQTITAEPYRGKRVRLSAYLRTQDAEGGYLWFRVDGQHQGHLAPLGYASTHDASPAASPTRGTTDWRRYELVLDVPSASEAIRYGAGLYGKGQIWMDDFRIDVVDRTVPSSDLTPTVGLWPAETEARMKAGYAARPPLPQPTNTGFEQ